MKKQNLYLQLIFVVSLVATLGSLYFSEIRQYIPCELCWYQRILMYPIVIISLIGIIAKDLKTIYYTGVFSAIGLVISSYHYFLQKAPMGDDLSQCTGVSCTTEYINWFGFITIPFLALIAFLIILIISIIAFLKRRDFDEQ